MSNFDDFSQFNRAFESTWTPVISDQSGNDGTTSQTTGTAMRFGNRVWISFGLVTSSVAGMVGTDFLRIIGLPYAPSAGSAIQLTSLDNLVLSAGDSLPRGYVDENSFPDAIAMQYQASGDLTGDTNLLVSQWSATATVIGSGFYITAD